MGFGMVGVLSSNGSMIRVKPIIYENKNTKLIEAYIYIGLL